MNITDLILILTAGIFASLSPCSFPLLPGYISYYIGANPSLTKVIPSIALCTLGLIIIPSIIGIGASLIGNILYQYIPFLPFIAGILIIIMSFFMFFNVNIKIPLKYPLMNKKKGMFGVFIYGIVYGLASASCATPVFLSIIFYAITLGSFYGVFTFIIYAIGMALPIAMATLLASKAKTFILKKFTKSMNMVQKIGAIVLFLIGIHLILGSLL